MLVLLHVLVLVLLVQMLVVVLVLLLLVVFGVACAFGFSVFQLLMLLLLLLALLLVRGLLFSKMVFIVFCFNRCSSKYGRTTEMNLIRTCGQKKLTSSIKATMPSHSTRQAAAGPTAAATEAAIAVAASVVGFRV